MRGRALRCVLLTLSAALLLVPAAQAGVKAPAGEFGTPPGLELPEGVAVNRSGAGGVTPGDVYVVDGGSSNSKVVEFSASGAFVRAWGIDVVASGPDDKGSSAFEICLPVDVCKGGFTNSAAGGMTKPQGVAIDQTTGTVYVVDANENSLLTNSRINVYSAKGAFEGSFGWDTIPSGAEGTGNLEAGSTEVKVVQTTKKAFRPGQAITGTGIPPGTTIAPATTIGAVGASTLILTQAATASGAGVTLTAPEGPGNVSQNEKQRVTIPSTVTSGNFKLTFTAPLPQTVANPQTTANIPFNATAAEVQEKLAALTNIGAGNVAVSLDPGGDPGGGATPGGPWTIEFKGTRYTDTNVAEMAPVAGSPNLSPAATASVITTAGGAGLEFCTTASGCQRGSSGGGAGQLPVSSLLRSLPAIDPNNGHLFVPEGGFGGIGAGNYRVEEFAPTFNGSEEVTGANFVKAVGWDVVASGPDQADEIQLVRVKASAGEFILKYKTEPTAALDFDATAEEVEDALNNLTTLTSDGFTATVQGGPGDPTASAPYKVTLRSSPKGKNAAQLEAVGSGGATVSVETYNDGGVGLEVCEAANGDACKSGLKSTSAQGHLGQFSESSPTSLAVDSAGTLYAVDRSENFGQAPARVLKLTFPAPGEAIATEFAPALLTQESGTPSAVIATDVAVDPETDNVVVAKKEGTTHYKFLEFDKDETLLFSSPVGSGLPVTNGGGLAIGTEERFYFTNQEGGKVIVLGPPPPPSAEMVAVDEVEATTATFQGKVTLALGPLGERFQTGYHFEYSKDGGASWTSVPTTDVVIGDGSAGGSSTSCPTPEAAVCEVSRKVSGLLPNTEYEARIVASNGSDATSSAISLTTKKAPPGISGTVAKEITQTTATLTAQLNPNNEETTYRFQWGESTAYDHETTATPAGTEPLEAKAPIGGLKEGTAYHFRLLATNPSGTTEGPDQEFSTLNGFELPNGREPEQVSANDKRPVGMVAQLLEGQIRYQASEDGNGAIYPVLNGLFDATGGGNVEYLGERGPKGWASTQLTPPALISPIAVGKNGGATGQVKYASGDLSCQLIQSPEPLGEVTPELEDNVAKGVINLFRRNADGTHTLLSPQPINFETQGNYHVDWASADCDHVLFDTNYRLLPGAPSSDRGLYEWDEGTLRLAGILPDGSVAASAVVGPGNGNYTNVNSMSEDGAKVFFTAVSDEGADSGKEAIFMREDGTETTDISQSETATVDQGARYAMATPNGSAVFFLANYGLAEGESSSGSSSCSGGPGGDGAGCDLYRYDTETGELTDLTADANPADKKGASVVGLLDASEDGSHVYFAARGQLVPEEGKTEAQNLAGKGSYNLYLNDGGALSYVGAIAATDGSDESLSGGDISFKFGHWVADATPDGGHLLFVSKEEVTGYPAGVAAQVYLYSAAKQETVCVSCRPDGQPSLAGSEATPLKQVTQKDFPANTDIQHRPRSLSDDGRHVFFTMPDVLAPGAIAGANNVYEWSEGQLYLLLAGEEAATKDFTEYEDSSPDGKDVFLVTKAKLVPQDFDRTTDLYDLRAPHLPGEDVGPEPLVVPPTPCDPLAEACQGPPVPQPAAPPAPASEGFSGAGNPPLAKPKRRHRKHKHRRHHRTSHHERGNRSGG